MFSLHTHSGEFCMHAKGKLEDLVVAAIKKGMRLYGLSEHMPRYGYEHLYPEERGISPRDLVEQFHSFVMEARRLCLKYGDQIELLIGIETEYIDDSYKNEIMNLKSIYGLDYAVGSLHHVKSIPIDFSLELFEKAEALFSDQPDSTSALFDAYFDEQFRMLEAIKPEVVGHFDLIRMYRPNKKLSESNWKRVKRNVNFVIAYGGLFEINTRGWKKLHSCYPLDDVLCFISDQGGMFTLGDDAHAPEDVGMHYDKLQDHLKRRNIKTLYALKKTDKGVKVEEFPGFLQ